MPKSKANNVIQIGQRSLVDAEAMGEMIGFYPTGFLKEQRSILSAMPPIA